MFHLAAPGCKWIYSRAVIALFFTIPFAGSIPHAAYHRARGTIKGFNSGNNGVGAFTRSPYKKARFFCHTKHTQTLLSIFARLCVLRRIVCAVAFTVGHSAHTDVKVTPHLSGSSKNASGPCQQKCYANMNLPSCVVLAAVSSEGRG
jgi:hypothetical protein